MTGHTKSPHHSLHGQLTNEVQNGVPIARSYDALNRPTGYILMQNGGASPPGEPFAVSYAYAPSTASAGVVSTQSRRVDFAYSYLPGTNLVSGKTATLGNHSPFSILNSQFAYEPHRDLVASVANTATNPSTLQPFNSSTDYVWGLDLNGTLQGAGGVGGLLAVVRDGETYFPTYDANGNVSEYISESGAIVAHYDYSPFGETVIETGDLASSFTHRFSTKPWCPVTRLYEYQMRKYRPEIGRWMSRDPIWEEGGIAILVFCLNNSIGSKGTKSFHIEWKRNSDPTSK